MPQNCAISANAEDTGEKNDCVHLGLVLSLMQVRARADKPSHAFAELFDLRENVDNTYEKKRKKKKDHKHF